MPSEWKVQMVGRSAAAIFTAPAKRSAISLAALLVKVMAAIARDAKPDSIRCASLAVITRVLPEPAPAMTRQGPSRITDRLVLRGIQFCQSSHPASKPLQISIGSMTSCQRIVPRMVPARGSSSLPPGREEAVQVLAGAAFDQQLGARKVAQPRQRHRHRVADVEVRRRI